MKTLTLKKFILKPIISFLALTLLQSQAYSCPGEMDELAAIKAIHQLSGGLSTSKHPTIETARSIVSISNSCDSSMVRVTAAFVLAAGVSSYPSPTETVAQSMESICGHDEDCALMAIENLKGGLSSSKSPTIAVAGSIVAIVRQVPTARVKSAAVSALDNCISSYPSPTKECAAAIVDIGNCELRPNEVAPRQTTQNF